MSPWLRFIMDAFLHGTLSRAVHALSGEFLSHTWLFLRLQTSNCVTGWTSQTVERQQLAFAPTKPQSSLVFKCVLSIITCPTTLTCWPCREFMRANFHFGLRVCGVISATTLVLSISVGWPNTGCGLFFKICCANAGSNPRPMWKS